MNKQIILSAAILLSILMMACSTLTPAERDARKAARTKYVTKVLNDRHYQIDVKTIYPRQSGAMTATSSWSLEVKGDTLVSYLPYFGVAHEAIYGNNAGLNFTAPIKTYKDSGFQKGKRTIRLTTENEGDALDYRVEVMDNGSATIDVISRKREGISYSGDITEK